MANQTLKEKTARGLLWGAFSSGSTQVLNIVIGIFLARRLSHDDYGIVAMLTIFTAIATNIQDSGFTNALINQKQTDHRDLNSVFWFNVLTSICLYLLLFFCSPLIAAFFRQPCLVELSRLVFLTFVIAALGIVHNAYLTKHLMNREKAVIGVVALVVSGCVALVLAYRGCGYWSIAWQQVSFNLVVLLGRLYYTPWHPTLHIDFSPVRRMFPFSVRILVTSIINTLSNNVLTLIFGRLYQASQLGVFNQAYQWDFKAHSFMNMTIAQVAQPVLATLNDEADRQLRAFRKMLRFAAFLSFPLMFGLAMVSEEFIVLTITEKWLPSVPFLRVLCVSGAFAPFYELYRNLAISEGRSDIYMRCNVAQILLLLLLIMAVHPWGIWGMVVAYASLNILWLLVWQLATGRLTGLRLVDALCDVMPFLLAAAAVMAVTFWLTAGIGNRLLLLSVRVVLAAVLYILIMKVARVKMLDECIAFIKR